MQTSTDPDLHRINTILDKLTIDSITLMEMNIQSKIEMEKLMSEGESNLAKARYIMGQNTVSKLQLPTEESNEFEALATIKQSETSAIDEPKFDLELLKKSDDVEKYQNPIKWFGILVPQNLHQAQERFRRSLAWVVKSANVQYQLDSILEAMKKLMVLKQQLKLNLEE